MSYPPRSQDRSRAMPLGHASNPVLADGPLNFIDIRHALSVANLRDEILTRPDLTPGERKLVLETPNKHFPTSPAGDLQAKATGLFLGNYLRDRGIVPDIFIVPDYTRPIQTLIGIIRGSGLTKVPIEINYFTAERCWGGFNDLSELEQEVQYARRDQDVLDWAVGGGEPLRATAFRGRGVMDTLNRRYAGKNVIAVNHGEFATALELIITRPSPPQFDKIFEAGVPNCGMFHYTREARHALPSSSKVYKNFEYVARMCVHKREHHGRSWDGTWEKITRFRPTVDDLEQLVMPHQSLRGLLK